MTDLKPCPFCGGKAKQNNQVLMGGTKHYDQVKCNGYRGQDLTQCPASRIWYSIEEWNTRHELPNEYTIEEVKHWFNKDTDAYGRPKKLMTKVKYLIQFLPLPKPPKENE